jgi:hypothetical protein
MSSRPAHGSIVYLHAGAYERTRLAHEKQKAMMVRVVLYRKH